MKYRIFGWVGCATAIAIASYGFWENSQQLDAQQGVGYVFAVIYGCVGGALFSVFLISLWVILTKAWSLISRSHAASATELEWPLVVLAASAIILIPLIGFYCAHSVIELRTANDPQSAPEVLWKIEKSALRWNDHRLMIALAKNPATPAGMFPSLLATDEEAVKGALIRNPNINSDTLTILAKDRDPHVRAYVATAPKLSIVALDQLVSSDPDAHVRKIARYWKDTREKK